MVLLNKVDSTGRAWVSIAIIEPTCKSRESEGNRLGLSCLANTVTSARLDVCFGGCRLESLIRVEIQRPLPKKSLKNS